MKKKLFIHVGMPKCGSSAIQTLLSDSVFYEDNQSTVYVAIDQFGDLVYGDKLFAQAKKSIFQYSSSVEISHLLKLEQIKKIDILNRLEFLFQTFQTIVISNEGWGVRPNEVNQFFETVFLTKSFDVHIIGFIRPQVEWFNSAWWQWGAWTNHSFDYWLERTISEPSWLKHIEIWNSFKWVSNTHFLLLNSNMIKNFLSLIGVQNSKYLTTTSNQSSCELLLRFFQLNREFREHAHASGKEFALNRWLDFEDKTTPFIINKSNIEKIIFFHQNENKQLIQHLSKEDQELLLNENSKWFSSFSFKDKNILQASPRNITDMEYQTLLRISKNAVNCLLEKCASREKFLLLDEEESDVQLEINDLVGNNFKKILFLDECWRKVKSEN